MKITEFQQVLIKDIRLIILLILGFLTILKILDVIVYAAVITYLFLPIHKKLTKKLWPGISAGFLTLFAIVSLILPVILLIRFFITNYEQIYFLVRHITNILQTQFTQFDAVFGSNISNLLLNKISIYFYNSISNSTYLLIKIFILSFLLFYFLRDHNKIRKYISTLFERIWKESEILKKIDSFVYSLLYGYFITAAIIGLLGGVLFWLLGYPFAILIAFVLALTTIIPIFGAWTICIPLAVYGGLTQSNYLLALTLIVIAIFLDSLKLYLISKTTSNKIKIHSGVILVGIIGGLYFYGPIGIIVGPIILGLVKILISHRFKI